MSEPDFISAKELAERTGFSLATIYYMHASGRGPLAPILQKLGSRVGAWRPDWESLVKSRLKLVEPEQRLTA